MLCVILLTQTRKLAAFLNTHYPTIVLYMVSTLPDTKCAALLCILSNSSLFFLVCGDHTIEQYSKFDLVIALYAFSFVVSFLTFRCLRRNPSNLLAFPVMLQMWVFHVRLLESVSSTKYLASLTSSSTLFIITLHIFDHFARIFNLHEVYWLYLTLVTWISLASYRLQSVHCYLVV